MPHGSCACCQGSEARAALLPTAALGQSLLFSFTACHPLWNCPMDKWANLCLFLFLHPLPLPLAGVPHPLSSPRSFSCSLAFLRGEPGSPSPQARGGLGSRVQRPPLNVQDGQGSSSASLRAQRHPRLRASFLSAFGPGTFLSPHRTPGPG